MYYYLMNTNQKEKVSKDILLAEPKSNLEGSEWIVETSVSKLDAILEFNSAQECRTYITENNPLWDEFYGI